MSGKIYGNRILKDTLASMISGGRLSHAFLLFGEKGLGKKLIAGEFAKQIVSLNYSAKTDINPESYPDIIWAEHSGAKQGFSVEYLRRLCSDAFILPNNGEKKVYILADCDSISIQAQNTLLKIIEEPPLFTYFIFTAQTKSVFLPTVLSRVISLGVTECEREECRLALAEKGSFTDSQIDEAVLYFGGNIGMSLNYLSGGELKKAVADVRVLIDAVCSKSEYSLLKALIALEGSRQAAKDVLLMALKVIRDSFVMRFGGAPVGCYPEGAEKLCSVFSVKKSDSIYDLFQKTYNEIDTNVNLGLELSSLCGQVLNI